IRVQIQLSRLPDGGRGRRDLHRRSDVLLAEHSDRWRQELPPWARGRSRVVYRRGFVHHVSMPASAFLRGAPTLFGVAPVESVELDRVGGLLADLAGSADLARLRRLSLRCNGLKADDLRGFLVNPALTNLRVLDLGFNDLGPDGGEVLAGAVGLSNLTELGLAGCSLGDEGAEGLAVAAR